MTGTVRVALALVVSVSAAAGCARGDEAQTVDTAANADTTGMAGMAGMAGHVGMMSGASMDSMHAHMAMMDTMSVASITAMFPVHRRMADSMLTRMSTDMRGMNVAANAEWSALADSLRADLDRMATMDGPQLKTAMGAHHQRMMRLMQMHRGMMGPPKTP